MVRRARDQGVDAHTVDLCELSDRYDVVTCVFDMLNYLSPDELPGFLACLRERLAPGGILLCDLNTLYGFEEVAMGAFTAEDEGRFVAIESDFEEGVYTADFTLFERDRGECWHRSSQTILQFFHEPETLARLAGLELLEREEVRLYAEEQDKEFLLYRRPR